MKIIGVTGGVGAGKSTVLGILQNDYGAEILMMDEIGRQLQQPGMACYEPMIDLFGRDVVLPDGTFNRQEIARQVFGDPEKLRQLNAIVHPEVRKEIDRRIKLSKEQNINYCILESAILIEAGYRPVCDEVWYIYADPEVRIKRLMESRGYSRERCLVMIQNQSVSKAEEAALTGRIDNSFGLEETKQQIARLISLC